eukprot:GEZU01023983.1.p1 GENE.GEZU01023983.1~~GEZU01023983.1.p1  ORF type:complete len:288 (-),score=47.71 GEZU01023983.1:299-1162(-)
MASPKYNDDHPLTPASSFEDAKEKLENIRKRIDELADRGKKFELDLEQRKKQNADSLRSLNELKAKAKDLMDGVKQHEEKIQKARRELDSALETHAAQEEEIAKKELRKPTLPQHKDEATAATTKATEKTRVVMVPPLPTATEAAASTATTSAEGQEAGPTSSVLDELENKATPRLTTPAKVAAGPHRKRGLSKRTPSALNSLDELTQAATIDVPSEERARELEEIAAKNAESSRAQHQEGNEQAPAATAAAETKSKFIPKGAVSIFGAASAPSMADLRKGLRKTNK